ncbi:hypothetical protein [Sporichthya brevicatena]|uniref:hypothetical protein n=1 Tax=Sporichthya brevicatena TaxID=171442 RepID=UPI0031CF8A2D
MTTLTLVLLVLLVIAAGAAAFAVHHRRSRAGGVLGVDRSGGRSRGRNPGGAR